MRAHTRIATLFAGTFVALLGGDAAVRADTEGPPPALDAFSETVLRGTRLAVSAHAAATASDGTVHVVYGDTLLRNTDGLAGSNPQFTEDEAEAARSVRRLAELEPRTILVGHGDPILNGASDALHELASSLS